MRKEPREIVYGGAVIGEEEIEAVVRVLRRGIQPGGSITAFERRIEYLYEALEGFVAKMR